MDPRGGFEPPLTESESAVLPLDDRGSDVNDGAGTYRKALGFSTSGASPGRRREIQPRRQWAHEFAAALSRMISRAASILGKQRSRPIATSVS